MDKCRAVQCNKDVMQNSLVDCCEEHELLLREVLDEEYQEYKKELYDDYTSDALSSIQKYYNQ